MELGIDLVKAAASFIPAVFGPQGGGAPGVAPAPDAGMMPTAPGGGVTAQVSPAIQTRISPQISPTMTQIQSSPGAGVMAAPQQYMPGGQAATTPFGVPGAEGGMLPMQPQPYGAPMPYGAAPSPYMPGAVPGALQPTRGLAGINWTPIAVAGIAAIAAMAILRRPRKRKVTAS